MIFQKFLIFHIWVCVTDSPRWAPSCWKWLILEALKKLLRSCKLMSKLRNSYKNSPCISIAANINVLCLCGHWQLVNVAKLTIQMHRIIEILNRSNMDWESFLLCGTETDKNMVSDWWGLHAVFCYFQMPLFHKINFNFFSSSQER